MINRKRLLCAALSLLVSPFSFASFANDQMIFDTNPIGSYNGQYSKINLKQGDINELPFKRMNAKNIVPNVNELSSFKNDKNIAPNVNLPSKDKLTENDMEEINSYFLQQIDQAFDHLVFLPEANYLALPLCDGHWATNAFCNAEVIKQTEFTRGLIMDMMLAICMYHLNEVHSMTPEERTENWNSLSVKIVRWLSDDHLPKGSQDSYEFWNESNAKIFNLCQLNTCQKSYNLMTKYLDEFEKTNGKGSADHILDMLYDNEYFNNKKDTKILSTVKGKVSEEDIKEITNYFLDQIEKAFDHLVFLPEANYLTLPLCDGYWATNAFCNPEAVKDPIFTRGLVMDMMLAVCMYHLNKVHTMTPEERQKNWDSISVKIVRWLDDGNLPEGSQTSYDFWTDSNAKIFNSCQWNACQQSYNLMTQYLNEFEKTNGKGSAADILDMLYPN